MSEYTAIYEACESLTELLRREMCPEPVPKRENIGLCEPQNPEDFQLTVWLYNIEEQRNSGTRGYIPDELDPNVERYSPARLKLSILISAHSKASAIQRAADEYRIIGRALQTVLDNPSIPNALLTGSLTGQRVPVLLETAKLSTEEMARIWNNSNKIIKPSFAVTLSQIEIKSNRVKQIAPRVSRAEFDTRQNAQRRNP